MLGDFKLSHVVVQLLVFISVSSTKASLTQTELREKYGQVETTFNDGKSCYRDCDGQTKTCYFEFHAQIYDTLNSLCGGCENGTLKDCFNRGCITGSGIERSIMTINQQLPGPAINVCTGDRIIVDVSNHMLGQGLTLHWHGMKQEKTPWMDGVPMVTQCPINVGNTFRYAFYAVQFGTYFWHAHSGVHRTNGITGTLVVRDIKDPSASTYDYDFAQHSILLFDWDNTMAEDTNPRPQRIKPLSSSVLINGFGSYYDPKTSKSKFAPMETFYVERGKRHRFRIMNAGSKKCHFSIMIDGQRLTVIASDGNLIEPFVVDTLVTGPGERFDVVVNATSDPGINERLLTVHALGGCKTNKIQGFARIIFVQNIFNHPKKIENHAPLLKRPSYDSMSLAAPKVTLNHPFTDCSTLKNHCIAALERKTRSNLVGINLRQVKPFKVIPFYFTAVPLQKRPYVYMNARDVAKVAIINGISNIPSSVPGLTQNDSNVQYCNANNLPKNYMMSLENTKLYQCPHLIPLKLDEVYEFLLIHNSTTEDASHPIHMHGNDFQIIDMGTNDQLKSGTTAFANATHCPALKDTVSIPRFGFVRIRLRTLNPGYWILHCHMEDHMSTGMMLTLKVGDKTQMKPPPANFPTCGNYLMPILQ